MQIAAQGDEAEVQTGQRAGTRAATPAIRASGRWMVTDRTMLNQILASAVAQREGLKVPTSPNEQQMQQASELNKQQGAEFDRTYINAQVTDHEKTVAAFKKETGDGQNPVLKRVAASALPVIEQHLTEARQLHQAPGNSSAASTQSR